MSKFLNRGVATIISLFIIWRLILFLVAFLSPLFVTNFGAKFPYYQERLISSGLPHFIWAFGNFDGVHYLGITQDGYAYQFTQVFFPLYPILVKITSLLTFGNLIIAALLVSNLTFLAALIIFYKLTSQIYNLKIALWSCLFLLSFPTSFYFGAIYTEGLFFLLTISFFYLLHQKRIILAALIGSSASATRLIGIFLALTPFFKKGVKPLMPILITPVGFLLYVLFLKVKFDNPLYFLSAQAIFGQERTTTQIILLPQVFWRYIKIFTTTSGLPLANAAFELSTTIFALAILVIAYKKIKLEWLMFSLLAIVTPTLTGTLASMPRYILVAFPIFIVLAHIKSLSAKIAILTIFLTLLTFAATLFTQGYWVA